MGLFTRSSKLAPFLASRIEELRAAIATPYLNREFGTHRAAVMSPKGGVGKTTTAAILGLILSELRGETVMALDGNLHTGTLRSRLIPDEVPPPSPILDLAAAARSGLVAPEWSTLARYSDLAGRLRVFSNRGANLADVEAMTGSDYHAVASLLSRAGQILISDMGTSVTSSFSVAAFDAADTLVVATDTDQESLELAVEMVSSLAGSPLSYRDDPEDYSTISDGRFAGLVTGAVVVISPGKVPRPAFEWVDLHDWFKAVCAEVVVVPHDPMIGGLIDVAALGPHTRIAHLRVAAAVAARFPMAPLSASRTARADF